MYWGWGGALCPLLLALQSVLPIPVYSSLQSHHASSCGPTGSFSPGFSCLMPFAHVVPAACSALPASITLAKLAPRGSDPSD